jgi:hypothetical protein
LEGAAVKSDGLPGPEKEPGEIDTSVAHAARVYDYLLGGKAPDPARAAARPLVGHGRPCAAGAGGPRVSAAL